MEAMDTPTSGSASMQMSPVGMDSGPTSNSNELRDDDEISLTSTAASESQDEYEVETIYAEERRCGVKTYLVKWKGYSDLRCTWEPASSFNGNDCLKNWKKKERAIKQGTDKPFNVQAWEAMIEASEDAKDERKRRRREKRARLGFLPSKESAQDLGSSKTKDQPVRPVQQVSEAEEESSASDDDVPLVQARARSNTPLPHPSQPNTPHGSHGISFRLKERDPAPEKRSVFTTPRPERPRIAAPEPVAITMTGDRTKRRTLPHILHRAKERRKSSTDENKTWKLYSTSNKFEKATRQDHEPIQGQLELQKPGDWTPFQMSSYLRGKQSKENDSLFVEQDDDDDDDDMNIDSPSTPLLNSAHSSPILTNTTFEKQLQISPVKDKNKFQFLSKPPTGPRLLTSPKKIYRVNSRELSKKSDLLCLLSYGSDEVDVGEVCLRDVSDSARRTIYTTKKVRNIDLSFDELCSLDHYRAITKETGNGIQFNGCITAFSDTQEKLTQFGKLLLEKDLVAMARIPNKNYPNFSITLLCFPAQSRGFSFLNRYSYEAAEGSLRIAGVIGLLPRVSQTRVRRDVDNGSEHGNSSKPERPERQGRFHQSTYSQKEDLLSQRRLSLGTPSVSRADMEPFATISTPHPLKIRKVSKTPILPSKRPSDKNTETAPKLNLDDTGPSIPQKLQLNTSMAKKTQSLGNTLSAEPESVDISPLTTSVNGKRVVNSIPKSAVQKLPSASWGLGGDKRPVTGSTPPDGAKAVEPSPDTRSVGPLSTISDAMDIADSSTDSPLASGNAPLPAADASMNEQPTNGSGDRQDVEMLDASAMENVNVEDYIKEAFPKAFRLNFNNIAAITSNNRTKSTNCFYLYFPEEANADFQILEKYLDSHFAIVLSNRRANDWEKFTKSQSGVALFHHSFMHYYALPGLHRLTRNTSFNFWNVSLSGKIPGLDQEVNFQRIFPNGAGFLMTEDFMLHEMDAAIVILSWFRENSKSKLPGSYRMMFRPDIMNWLNAMSEKDPRFTVMAVLIGDIACRGDSSNWPTEPRDLDQFADPLLQSPAVSLQNMPKPKHISLETNTGALSDKAIQQRNGDYVCEIFSAWALLNAASMRRFCIITHDEPREPWRSWTHLEISRGPNEFYQKWGVHKEHYTKWLAQDTSKPPANVVPGNQKPHGAGSPVKSVWLLLPKE